MSTEILYVHQHTVCRSAYMHWCISINIQYVNWHTVCRSTYTVCMLIDIHGVYVDWYIICQSRYCMSIDSCSQLNWSPALSSCIKLFSEFNYFSKSQWVETSQYKLPKGATIAHLSPSMHLSNCVCTWQWPYMQILANQEQVTPKCIVWSSQIWNSFEMFYLSCSYATFIKIW